MQPQFAGRACGWEERLKHVFDNLKTSRKALKVQVDTDVLAFPSVCVSIPPQLAALSRKRLERFERVELLIFDYFSDRPGRSALRRALAPDMDVL